MDQILHQSRTIKQLSVMEQLMYTPSASSSAAGSAMTADSQIEVGFITQLMDLEREHGITILS